MSSAFFGLHIGRTALMSNQMAIDVTGHNLSNVGTEGYSRQRVNTEQVDMVSDVFGTVGAGVQALGVDRIHETYLERQIARVQTQTSYDSVMVAGLDELQSLLDESGGAGLNAALSDFWNSWEALSIQPTDAGLRAQVLEAANVLASRYNERIDGLLTAEQGFNTQIESRVDQANELLRKVAELNLSVAKAEAGGHPANDLRDQLDTAARQVAELLGVEPEYDGSFVNLKVPDGGPYLVYGKDAYTLSAVKDATGRVTSVNLENYPLSVATGEIGAYFALRDDVASGLRDDLEEFMARVTDRVNALHNAGYDMELRPGENLFLWGGAASDVQVYPSGGLFSVEIGTALQAGTHLLEVVSVDQATGAPLAANDYGTLTSGQVALTHAAGNYTGENALNLDYHVRILDANTAAGDLAGMRVQLYRGDEAVSPVSVLPAGASQTLSWTVDGMTLDAQFSFGAGQTFFNAGERSDGLSTTGTVSLDGGAAVAVDHTLSYAYNFVGGGDNLFRAGGAAEIEFSLLPFRGSSFTVTSSTGTLSINPDIAADMGRIAAAAPNASGAAEGDGEMARRIADLAIERMFEYTNETAAGRLGRTVQELGEKGSQAMVFETASQSILAQIDRQKQSISGVNTDEEMVLLIQFQRGFEAAARFVTASDDLLDVVINRLGRVGL